MKTVSALYEDYPTAERVVEDLVSAGFSRSNISIVANDATGDYNNRYVTRTDDVKGGEGASFGAVAGAAVGLGAMLIPGIGPVIAAGPLLAGLVGAGVGAVTGAVTGGVTASLVNFGVPEETAGYYAEGVRRGGALVVVEADDTRTNQAEMVLNRYRAVDVKTRAADWRSSGWSGYDSSSPAYTAEEIEAERRRYNDNLDN